MDANIKRKKLILLNSEMEKSLKILKQKLCF